MRRLGMILLLAIATISLSIAANSANAQDGNGRQQDRPERGRNRGQRGGPRGFGQFGAMGQPGLLGLVRNEEVQEEVELDEDQLAAIQALAEETNESRPEPPGDFRELTQEERETFRKSLEEWQAKHNDAVKAALKTLLKTEQFDRLMQISIQQQGAVALRDQDVATKLNLTKEQGNQIATKIESSREALQAEMRAAFAGGPGGDREAMREKVEQLRKKMDEEILSILTDDQKALFESMKGEEFKLTLRAFGPRGGGPGERPRRNRNNDSE